MNLATFWRRQTEKEKPTTLTLRGLLGNPEVNVVVNRFLLSYATKAESVIIIWTTKEDDIGIETAGLSVINTLGVLKYVEHKIAHEGHK